VVGGGGRLFRDLGLGTTGPGNYLSQCSRPAGYWLLGPGALESLTGRRGTAPAGNTRSPGAAKTITTLLVKTIIFVIIARGPYWPARFLLAPFHWGPYYPSATLSHPPGPAGPCRPANSPHSHVSEPEPAVVFVLGDADATLFAHFSAADAFRLLYSSRVRFRAICICARPSETSNEASCALIEFIGSARAREAVIYSGLFFIRLSRGPAATR
jgi:hypothetical protein